MKCALLVLVLGAVLGASNATAVNPIEKVLSMISDLQSKVIAEGTAAQKTYNEYAEFCEDKARNIGFEIKTGKASIAELKATIESESATIEASASKIEELSSDISSDEADLKAATGVRKKEKADFAAEEAELTATIDALERAISILSKEMAKGAASMLQLNTASSVTDALAALVNAASLGAEDGAKLTALVQERSQEQEEDAETDEELGAPAAAVYENKSGGIVSTLEGLLEKAETQLEKARKAESTAAHNYAMLKQSLEDEMKYAEKDMAEAKATQAASTEAKSVAEGELEATSKDLAADVAAKEELHHDCMSAATEFEAAVTSRGEELGALAKAKKVIEEATGGAESQTYLNQVNFLQMRARSQLRSKADLAKFEAVRLVRSLANKHHSSSLAQLASKMSSALRLGAAAGEDPFTKVKGLITDMIASLEAEAGADASQKAYCDKEMSETTEKKEEKTAEAEKLTTKIDQKKAASVKLKEAVATLQKELASMTKSTAEATKLRQEEKAAYEKNEAEMSQGLKGVQLALKVLKDYYAKGDDASHGAASGAGSGIIGLLEVVESDFTKGLAEMTAEEETAAAEYEAMTKSSEVEVAAKEKDASYKTKEFKSLDKAVAELSADLSGVEEELSAITEYDAKIKKTCIVKPTSYEETKARRESEIAGLKEALSILEGESFLQRGASHSLRGVRAHRA